MNIINHPTLGFCAGRVPHTMFVSPFNIHVMCVLELHVSTNLRQIQSGTIMAKLLFGMVTGVASREIPLAISYIQFCKKKNYVAEYELLWCCTV